MRASPATQTSSIFPGCRNSVQFACPRCEEVLLQPVGEDPGDERLSCPRCNLRFGAGGPAPRHGRPVQECWLCGNREFYLQKDFNRQLGFAIVLVSFFVIFLVMHYIGHREGIVCLLALALIDWVIYNRIATVTVCYLCHGIYRGFPLNREHRGFYLGSEEKHKHLRKRWLESIPADR